MMQRLLLSLIALLLAVPAWAVAPQQVLRGSAITWGDSATTENLDLQNLANGAGRMGSYTDRGTTVHDACYLWRCTIQTETTVTVGTSAEVYLSTSTDCTVFDGVPGMTDTADAALTTDKRQNLKLLGLVLADQTAATTNMSASGDVCVPARCLAMGLWNATGQALENTANAAQCSLTPYHWETP